jgi:K(+)-stimulated pyrophosphate-energized sodium pump
VCVVLGSVGGIVIGLVHRALHRRARLRSIAKAGKTGVATVIIAGLAVGMQSVVIPVDHHRPHHLIASLAAGLYGVGIAAVGMLATVGITMASTPTARSPTTPAASPRWRLGKKTREITDALDEVGNTTAAIGKGFAIGAASLAALTIIAAFIEVVQISTSPTSSSLAQRPATCSWASSSAASSRSWWLHHHDRGRRGAFEMIEEIRRQFREIPGLLEGRASRTRPCVASPPRRPQEDDPAGGHRGLHAGSRRLRASAPTFGGMLIGALLGCVLLALFMANSGGAWDNAKKYVEQGNHGGKNSEAHRRTWSATPWAIR